MKLIMSLIIVINFFVLGAFSAYSQSSNNIFYDATNGSQEAYFLNENGEITLTYPRFVQVFKTIDSLGWYECDYSRQAKLSPTEVKPEALQKAFPGEKNYPVIYKQITDFQGAACNKILFLSNDQYKKLFNIASSEYVNDAQTDLLEAEGVAAAAWTALAATSTIVGRFFGKRITFIAWSLKGLTKLEWGLMAGEAVVSTIVGTAYYRNEKQNFVEDEQVDQYLQSNFADSETTPWILINSEDFLKLSNNPNKDQEVTTFYPVPFLIPHLQEASSTSYFITSKSSGSGVDDFNEFVSNMYTFASAFQKYLDEE